MKNDDDGANNEEKKSCKSANDARNEAIDEGLETAAEVARHRGASRDLAERGEKILDEETEREEVGGVLEAVAEF